MNVGPQVVYFGINEQITLSREGVWLSNGEEITHEATVRAFFRHLEQDPAGQWWIRIGNEKKPVLIEDTPAFVRAVSGSAEQGYLLELLGRDPADTERLEPSSLRYSPGRLTCRTREGREARFLRAPYHEFLRILQKDEAGYFVVIQGVPVRIQ